MFDNIMGEMAKIATQASTAISAPIVYLHKKSGVLQDTSNVLAVSEPLENYKIEGNVISSGRKFIISKNIENSFLKLECKQNDVIIKDGVSWFVAVSFPTDVELVVVCSVKAFSLTTRGVKYI